MKKIVLVVLCLLNIGAYAQTVPSVPIANQWHFEGNHPDANTSSGNGWDWIFSIIPTPRKEYIACGYGGIGYVYPAPDQTECSMLKLDNLGNLKWSININDATSSALSISITDKSGTLYQVVKTPNGYAACGYIKDVNQDRFVVIVEVDENGNFIHNTPTVFKPQLVWNGLNYKHATARTLAMSPNNDYIIIGGEIAFDDPGNPFMCKAFISKISYTGSTLTQGATWVGPAAGVGEDFTADPLALNNDGQYFFAGGSRIHKLITESTGGSTFNVYACGYRSMPGDNVEVEFQNLNSTDAFLYKRNKDIWVVSIDDDMSTVNFNNTYNKGSGNLADANIFPEYRSRGPLTARGMLGDNYNAAYDAALSGVDEIQNNLNNTVNEDERGWDIIRVGNDLLVLGLTNSINIGQSGYNFDNGSIMFNNSGGVPNLFHTITTSYSSYVDGDAHLLSINKNSGSLGWTKSVAHLSSKDFIPAMVEKNGEIVIAASLADKIPTGAFPGLNEPDWYDAFMTSVPHAANNGSNGDHLWRRNFHSTSENAICIFTVARTADGGFVIGGDNDDQSTNYSIYKMASPCAPQGTGYQLGGVQTYTVPTSTTWSASGKIKSKVIVPNGVTLTISNCTLSFASSDHMYDFTEFQSYGSNGKMIGIVVQPGGKLILNNATLRGINECGETHMWDGIVVVGNVLAQQSPTTNQGHLAMTNSTIRDARYGVSAARTDRYFNASGFNTTGSYGVASQRWGSVYNPYWFYDGGGIVNISGSNITNCYYGAYFGKYQYNNAAVIGTSIFTTNSSGMADLCHLVDETGAPLAANTHISTMEIKNLFVHGSTFDCATSFPLRKRSFGITSRQSGLTAGRNCIAVDGCGNCISGTAGNTFRNLIHGIQTILTGGKAIRIADNTFENNNYGVKVGSANNILNLSTNVFKVPGYSYGGWHAPTGAQILGCHGYNVHSNVFDKYNQGQFIAGVPKWSVGIVVNNGHGMDDIVKSNVFNNLFNAGIGLQTNKNGSGTQGLQFKAITSARAASTLFPA
jgi:hypothetical protein